MRMRYGYRTLIRQVQGAAADFSGATLGDPGQLIFNDFLPKSVRDLFTPWCAISMATNFAMTTLLVEFVDPDTSGLYRDPVIPGPTFNKKIILRDATGTLTDFVEDNLGQGWPLLPRTRTGLPYQLQVTTTGAAAPETVRVLIVEYWNEPRWPKGKAEVEMCKAGEWLDRRAEDMANSDAGNEEPPRRAGIIEPGDVVPEYPDWEPEPE